MGCIKRLIPSAIIKSGKILISANRELTQVAPNRKSKTNSIRIVASKADN